ncbi:MAG: hypothetical protein AB7P33_17940 [Dehalococcoidia bacterium]
MEEVLLVGPESPFLRILAAVLARDWYVKAAYSQRALEQILATIHPDVIIFDHTQPTDLFELNPRQFGFAGPLVLLAEEPSTAIEVLRADTFIPRPSDLFELARLIENTLRRSRGE